MYLYKICVDASLPRKEGEGRRVFARTEVPTDKSKDSEPKTFGGPTTVDRKVLDQASAENKRVKEDPPISPRLTASSTRVVGERR